MIQKKILIWCGIVIVVVLVIFLLESFQKREEEIKEKGEIILQEEESEFQKPEDDLWEQADEEYETSRPNGVAIVDDNSVLSTEDFLPLKAHFFKSDAIGTYLAEQGYKCSEVIVIEDSLKKEGNNSYFEVQLMEYPDITLHITWYGMTEEWDFLLTEG